MSTTTSLANQPDVSVRENAYMLCKSFIGHSWKKVKKDEIKIKPIT